jgi:hypothetical protein
MTLPSVDVAIAALDQALLHAREVCRVKFREIELRLVIERCPGAGAQVEGRLKQDFVRSPGRPRRLRGYNTLLMDSWVAIPGAPCPDVNLGTARGLPASQPEPSGRPDMAARATGAGQHPTLRRSHGPALDGAVYGDILDRLLPGQS